MAIDTAAGTRTATSWSRDITRTQWLVLAGTTLGWGLDGFAGSLYVLVLGPAMTELLPNSGVEATRASIGVYGGLTMALFLAGWATGGILFGILADYFGRTKVLSAGILTYAVFSAAAARMSAFSAFSLIASPSWMSMARRTLPSRLELKRRAGSLRAAPLAKVSFTLSL